MATKKGPRPKHIPIRTCVACKEAQAKRGLVRIVRVPSGQVEVDPTGKKAGRGAYLCRARACWEVAFRKKTLEHALQASISPENKVELEQYFSALPD